MSMLLDSMIGTRCCPFVCSVFLKISDLKNDSIVSYLGVRFNFNCKIKHRGSMCWLDLNLKIFGCMREEG